MEILTLAAHLPSTYITTLDSEVPIVSQHVCVRTGGRPVISSTVPVTPSHWPQFHIQMSHINQIYAKWPFLHAHVVICMKNSKHYIIWNISFCSHLTINSRLIINFPNFDKRYKVRAVTCIALAGQWQPHTKKYNFLFFNFGMKTLFCIPWCVHLLYALLLCTL